MFDMTWCFVIIAYLVVVIIIAICIAEDQYGDGWEMFSVGAGWPIVFVVFVIMFAYLFIRVTIRKIHKLFKGK